MKTVKKCLQAIKETDPETCISEWHIRQLCKSGKVACDYSGSKLYVNFDSLLSYFNRGLTPETNDDNGVDTKQ